MARLGAKCTILLAHGAGGAMDTPTMTAAAKALAEAGFRVARFEFEYMAARRRAAARKPPPRAETLCPEYLAAIDALKAKGPLIIGGKSMGGRIASMIADDLMLPAASPACCVSAIPSTRQANPSSCGPLILRR